MSRGRLFISIPVFFFYVCFSFSLVPRRLHVPVLLGICLSCRSSSSLLWLSVILIFMALLGASACLSCTVDAQNSRVRAPFFELMNVRRTRSASSAPSCAFPPDDLARSPSLSSASCLSSCLPGVSVCQVSSLLLIHLLSFFIRSLRRPGIVVVLFGLISASLRVSLSSGFLRMRLTRTHDFLIPSSLDDFDPRREE